MIRFYILLKYVYGPVLYNYLNESLIERALGVVIKVKRMQMRVKAPSYPLYGCRPLVITGSAVILESYNHSRLASFFFVFFVESLIF